MKMYIAILLAFKRLWAKGIQDVKHNFSVLETTTMVVSLVSVEEIITSALNDIYEEDSSDG